MEHLKRIYFFLNCGNTFRLARLHREIALEEIFGALSYTGYDELDLCVTELYQRLLQEQFIKESIVGTFKALYCDAPNDPARSAGYGYVRRHLFYNTIADLAEDVTGNHGVDAYLSKYASRHTKAGIMQALKGIYSVYVASDSEVYNEPSYRHTVEAANGKTYEFVETSAKPGQERTIHATYFKHNTVDVLLRYSTEEAMLYWELHGRVIRPVREYELEALLYTALYSGFTKNIDK